MIDLQSFRAAITAQIEKVARDHRHRFEIPLAEVVTYAGVGAARAAQQWNDISHKECVPTSSAGKSSDTDL